MLRLAVATAAVGVALVLAPPAQACMPWDCPNIAPNPGPGGDGWYGPGNWYWGDWYGPGWYGGHYWRGGNWYGHWY